MAAAKKSPSKAHSRKAAPKAAKKAPAKSVAKPKAAPKAVPKPVLALPSARPAKPGKAVSLAASADDSPVVEPAAIVVVPRADGRDVLCHIEILKDGHFFIARTAAEGIPSKEYKNTVFEDMLTEMVITLQEQLADK